jgi:flagellar basal body-associated protein FliL
LFRRVPEDSANISNDRSTGGRGGRVWIFVVTVLAVVGIWFWASRGKEPPASESGEKRVQSTLHLETFVLNLADNDQKSYLRVGIDLGLNHEAKHGEEPAPVAEVRDTILGVLGEAKVDDLLTAQGKTRLKEDLLHALQQRMPEAGVEEVYFTEFLIQR